MPSPIPRRVRREGGQSSRTPMWLPSHPALRRGIQRIPAKVIPPFGKQILHLFIITFFSLPNRLRCGHPVIPHFDAGSRGYPPWSSRTFGKHIPHLFIITFFSLPNRPRCGHPVIPHFDAGSREYRQRSSRTFGKLIPHFFIITFLVCSIAPDAVSQSSRTPMRDSGISAKVIPRSDAGSREYRQVYS